MEHLRRCVKVDSVPVQVIDMTKLNLVELTRKKVEKSLAEQLTVIKNSLRIILKYAAQRRYKTAGSGSTKIGE